MLLPVPCICRYKTTLTHTKRGRLLKPLLPLSLLPKFLPKLLPLIWGKPLRFQWFWDLKSGGQGEVTAPSSGSARCPQFQQKQTERGMAGNDHIRHRRRGSLLPVVGKGLPIPTGDAKHSHRPTWYSLSCVSNAVLFLLLAVPQRYSDNNTQKCLPLKQLRSQIKQFSSSPRKTIISNEATK